MTLFNYTFISKNLFLGIYTILLNNSYSEGRKKCSISAKRSTLINMKPQGLNIADIDENLRCSRKMVPILLTHSFEKIVRKRLNKKKISFYRQTN